MFRRAVMRAWLLLLVAIGGAGTARAQNFDFSYTANGVSTMGTFVTTSQGSGQYLITSILNGTRGGNAIALLAPGNSGGNDNLLFFPANPTYIDFHGFSFSQLNTGQQVNVYYQSGYREFGSLSGTYNISNFQVTAPAPLPGGGLLSFLALGLAGLVARRTAILRFGRDALGRLRPLDMHPGVSR